MPHRIELTEAQSVEIGGVPVAVGLARGCRVVLFVAADDGSGLIESADDCRRAASRYRAKVDTSDQHGHDI